MDANNNFMYYQMILISITSL